ncbi:uncharacterized protein [Eurosta solidaginis]|uniref:uncharacterized protein isoform X1 n=1 Tax=Eurosta solidaginis TaxID=178769 RepID=UPI00353154AC
MDTNELVERQKLVPNDVEGEEDQNNLNTEQTAPKSAAIPSSPTMQKINLKNISSGDTTRSRNSANCSIEHTSERGHLASAKVMYINERRPRSCLHGSSSAGGVSNDEGIDIKSRPRKLLKETDDHSVNGITVINSESFCNNSDFMVNHQITDKEKIDSFYNKGVPRKVKGLDPSIMFNTSNADSGPNSDRFDDRPIKHHSFVSEVPDVKHMERALLGLLDDFHSGKLKAFGSGCTMEQMTKIREQQESLAKLHFELAAAEEDSLESVNDFSAAKAQENMLQLVQRLEQLSISIEQLQTSHPGL